MSFKMTDYYLSIKALHIIFFTSWFAGLFYLPRIYVNLAIVDNESTYKYLLMMATKLYRFVTPIMFITIGLGALLLFINSTLLTTGWMQIKLVLVSLLVGYHYVCGFYLQKFNEKQITKGHIYYRWFNEFPVLILAFVVFLAITKNF